MNACKSKRFAPGEARTHGLQIMRLTRCLLRYGGLWKNFLNLQYTLIFEWFSVLWKKIVHGENWVKVWNLSHCKVVRQLSCSFPGNCQVIVRPAIVRLLSCRQLSGCCQAVVRQLSGSCQAVVRQLSGSCQAVVRQLSGSCQAVVRQSSGSCQAVIKKSICTGGLINLAHPDFGNFLRHCNILCAYL